MRRRDICAEHQARLAAVVGLLRASATLTATHTTTHTTHTTTLTGLWAVVVQVALRTSPLVLAVALRVPWCVADEAAAAAVVLVAAVVVQEVRFAGGR